MFSKVFPLRTDSNMLISQRLLISHLKIPHLYLILLETASFTKLSDHLDKEQFLVFTDSSSGFTRHRWISSISLWSRLKNTFSIKFMPSSDLSFESWAVSYNNSGDQKEIHRLFVCAPWWFAAALLFSVTQQPVWQAWKWSRTFANGSEMLGESPLIWEVPGWLTSY